MILRDSEFRLALLGLLDAAAALGQERRDVAAAELHRRLGGLGGPEGLRICCRVMLQEKREFDELLVAGGKGPSGRLTIRYLLPRP